MNKYLLIIFTFLGSIISFDVLAQNSVTVTVFRDTDGNGLDDNFATVAGLTNADLFIVDGGGIQYNFAEATPGVYVFDESGAGLPDGTYSVQYNETAWTPAAINVGNEVFAITEQGFGGANDSDFDPISGISTSIVLTGDNTVIDDIDLGLYFVTAIGDFVWEDINGDGEQDGELGNGIDGVAISLLDGLGNPALDTDGNAVLGETTAGGGNYLFGNLPPGDYIVQFSLPTVGGLNWFATTFNPATFSNDSDADPNNSFQSTIYTVAADVIYNENIDAGFLVPSIIGNMVWEDLDGNGMLDGADAGIDGVTVSLLDDTGAQATGADGLPIVDQITMGGGMYQFMLVPPGDYQVQFNLPNPIGLVDWYPTEFDATHTDANDPDNDSDANNDSASPDYLRSHIISLLSNEMDEELRIDAGFWLPAKIGNLVFCDENGNGIDDDGVGGVGNIDVSLFDVNTGLIALDAEGDMQSLKTGIGGDYEFELIPPGEYYAEFSFPGAPGPANPPFQFTLQDEGADDTVDSDADPAVGGTFGQTANITITSRDTEEEVKWDAGVYQSITISGTIWFDDNNNTALDGIENGPAGVLVNLYNANDLSTPIDDVLTNAGVYEFPSPGVIIPPGEYVVEIDGTAFAGPLSGAQPCVGFNDANDMVDSDDNGNDSQPAQSTPFTILSNCDVSMPPLVTYVDFCYFFDCNTENSLASTSCNSINDSDIICDIGVLGSFCNIMPNTDSPDNDLFNLCPDDGGGAPHNISWFAFVAYGGTYSVTVTPTNCSGATGGMADGVQIGLYTDCTYSESVYCNPGCNVDPVTFGSDILEEGQTYYFFIDGCSGSVCSYEVEITGNPEEPNLMPSDLCIDDNGTLVCTDNNIFCPDTEVNFEVQGLNLTVDYNWDIVTVSGDQYTGDAAPSTTDGTLPIIFDTEGEYQVCISNVNNGCQNWSGAICRTVIIATLQDEEFDMQELCDIADFDPATLQNATSTDPMDPNEDGTLGWQGADPFVIGNNIASITTAAGCEYEQEVELSLYPVSDVGLVNEVLCRGDLPITIDGTQYTEVTFGGDITFSLPDLLLVNETDVNGCDSIIDIELEILDVMAQLDQGVCTPDGVILELSLDPTLSTDMSFITWEWTDPNGDVLTDDVFNPTDILDNVAPSSSGNGTYTLTATIEKNGTTCIVDFTTVIDFDQLLPPLPTIAGPPLMLCESDSVQTYTATDFGDAFNYIWETPTGVTVLSGGGLNDQTIEINWAGSTGGMITLTGVNGCGEGDPTSIDVTLVPLLTPDFTATATVCQDSSAVIEFSGPTADIDSYAWDFDGGSINNATGGVGPGPHEVSWPDGDIDHTVTLTVTHNGGCTSTETFQVVSIVEPLTPPTVNCNPATGEVSFTWDDVADATGYDVVVTSTDTNGDLHTGTLNGTTFTVSGLDEGETVVIELIVFTGDACQMVTSISPGCTSQNCVAPTITLDAGDGPGTNISFCTADVVGTIDISPAITSGESGSGTFSGPGITDAVAGTFDPLQANIGVNTITYVFMTDDPVPCIGNQTIQVEVFETPMASFTLSDDTICITDAVVLTYDGSAGINSSMYTVTDGQTFNQSEPTISFALEGEQTITLIVERDGCESEEVTRTIFVQPELDAINVTCSQQEINLVEFSWNDVDGASGYEVIVTNADGSTDPAFTTSSTTYMQSGLDPGDIISITVNVLSDSRCPGSTFTQMCEAMACPTFVFAFDNPETSLCVAADGSTPPISLQADASGGDGTGSYTWSGSPNITDDQFDPNGLAEGQYELFVTYNENGCEGDGSVLVNITLEPTAAFDITTDPVCVGSTELITFTGSNLSGQVLDWGGSNVSVTGSGSDYMATFDQVGTFDIVLNVVNGTCTTSPATASVTVEPELVFGDIDCDEELDQISFSWDPVDCATEYEVFIDGVSQGIQTTTTFLATGLIENQEVELEVIAVSGCACGNVINTRMCQARPCVQVGLDVSAMGDVTDFCFASDLASVDVLAELTDNTGDGTGTYSGVGVDPVTGTFDPIAAGIGSHTIMYTWVEPEGCEEFQDSVTFNIFENPEVAAVADPIDCYDDTLTMLSITPTLGDGAYTVTSGGEDIDLMSEVEAGTYDIMVIDGNMCSAETSVTVSIPAEPMPTITGSEALITGQSSDYSISQSVFTGLAIDSVVWTANGTILCNDAGCFSIDGQTPTENTTYEVTVFYNNGCSVVRSIEVEVTEPDPIFTVDIPNAISPNKDGQNDVWSIVTGDPEVVVNSIQIVDRWGNLVWENSTPYNPGNPDQPVVFWDGKFNGSDLQPGVYVYSVSYNQDGRDRVRNGDITIIDVR